MWHSYKHHSAGVAAAAAADATVHLIRTASICAVAPPPTFRRCHPLRPTEPDFEKQTINFSAICRCHLHAPHQHHILQRQCHHHHTIGRRKCTQRPSFAIRRLHTATHAIAAFVARAYKRPPHADADVDHHHHRHRRPLWTSQKPPLPTTWLRTLVRRNHHHHHHVDHPPPHCHCTSSHSDRTHRCSRDSTGPDNRQHCHHHHPRCWPSLLHHQHHHQN